MIVVDNNVKQLKNLLELRNFVIAHDQLSINVFKLILNGSPDDDEVEIFNRIKISSEHSSNFSFHPEKMISKK
jgi:hypothetical protein